jgi:predicted small lipoprotein YifL
MRRIIALFLLLSVLVSLTACGSSAPATSQEEPQDPSSVSQTEEEMTESTPEDSAESQPESTPETQPYFIYDPTVMPEGGVRDGINYVAYNGVVEHLFFHPVIAYPEQAFDGDHMSDGYDDWMVTVGEYNKILQSVYEKGFVLVDISDCWSEGTAEDGTPRMVKNTLYLPEGKKPLIISYDDVNYNLYTLGDGFTYKLIFGEDGKLWSWGYDPAGNEVVSRDLDAITILDKFVEEHPDFSPFGAKGCLSITGYEGILGYRTQTDSENWTAEREAERQKEIEAVKPIVAELKRTGWTFGSHTWGHISLNSRNYETVTADMQRWFDEVGSLVGDVDTIFYPFGGRLDGDDVNQTGPAMQWMVDNGFRIFCSVGINSYSKIKSDTCAVICDRLHPDGTTLRGTDKVLGWYAQFYDARDIIDLEVRPEREVRWTPKTPEVPPAETTDSVSQ